MAKTSYSDRIGPGDDEITVTFKGDEETLQKMVSRLFELGQEFKVQPEKQKPPCRGCGKDD